MENEIDIQNLLTEGEHMALECKTATKSVPNSVWDTYSAFANTYGGIILLGVSEHMDDIDLPTLKAYRMMFSTINSEHVWNGLDNKEFLQQLGGYTINRKEGMEGLTLAGLLMFGKGLPVRERFDNLRMDYIDKSHLIGDQRYSDRLTYDGTWENNLFNFMRLILPKLTRELPRPFQMEGIIRNDDTLQHKAIREAVTNMVIHADLMMNGLLRIEKYDDRIVLTNPGLLKLPLEQIYSGGESKARNQRMQNMLRMIGFGENLGSGFPLILHAWDKKHWTKPELIEQPELMQVKLVLQLNPRLGENTNKHPTSTDQVPTKYRPSFMNLHKYTA